MKTYGLVSLIEKGIHYGSDDVYIKECPLKVGKHRHQHARAKALIYNEMKNMEE